MNSQLRSNPHSPLKRLHSAAMDAPSQSQRSPPPALQLPAPTAQLPDRQSPGGWASFRLQTETPPARMAKCPSDLAMGRCLCHHLATNPPAPSRTTFRLLPVAVIAPFSAESPDSFSTQLPPHDRNAGMFSGLKEHSRTLKPATNILSNFIYSS